MEREKEILKEKVKTTKEIILIEKIFIYRTYTMWDISDELSSQGGLKATVYLKDLDSKLWEPYGSWHNKVLKMPINFNAEKKESEELEQFKEEMITAIRKRRKEVEDENVRQKTERETDLN